MVDKVYSVAVRWLLLGVFGENVLYMRKVTAGDPTPSQLLAFANAWKEVARPSQSDGTLYIDYIATQVLGDGVTYSTGTCRQLGGTINQGVLTGTLVGGTAGDVLPIFNTMSVNVHTALRGRSYRTRKQLGCFVETQNTNGAWTAGLVSAIQTTLNTFRGVYGSGGTDPDMRWCTFSRGIASGCYPDPNVRHHPLTHIKDGNPDASIANVTNAIVTSHITTTRSRII